MLLWAIRPTFILRIKAVAFQRTRKPEFFHLRGSTCLLAALYYDAETLVQSISFRCSVTQRDWPWQACFECQQEAERGSAISYKKGWASLSTNWRYRRTRLFSAVQAGTPVLTCLNDIWQGDCVNLLILSVKWEWKFCLRIRMLSQWKASSTIVLLKNPVFFMTCKQMG